MALRKEVMSRLVVPSVRNMSNNSTREKVVLKPGYSLLGWENTKRNPDFRAGYPPYPVRVSKEELKKHNTLEDYWICINRKVYNLTPYLDYHPGGVDILKACAGKDGTLLFNKYHSWVNADLILDLCFIGILV